jgi:hypothetical protein
MTADTYLPGSLTPGHDRDSLGLIPAPGVAAAAAGRDAEVVHARLPQFSAGETHDAPVDKVTYELMLAHVNALRGHPAADLDTIAGLLYLHRAAIALFGDDHESTRQKHESLRRFAAGYARERDLLICPSTQLSIAGLSAPLDDVPALRVAQRMSNAHMLHRHGCCLPARREAIAALHQWRPRARLPLLKCTYVLRTMHLLACCGARDEAAELLDQTADTMLPKPGDSLHPQVMAAASQLNDPHLFTRHRNICAREPDWVAQYAIIDLVFDHFGLPHASEPRTKPRRWTAAISDQDRTEIFRRRLRGDTLTALERDFDFPRKRIAQLLTPPPTRAMIAEAKDDRS